MERINQYIIQERQMIKEALQREEKAMKEDREYSIYHEDMANYYERIVQTIDSIVAFKGSSDENFIIAVANQVISEQQTVNFLQLRNLPLYKRALGETALLKKEKLETILNFKITNEGILVYKDGKYLRAVKIPQELEEEGNWLSDKVSSLYQEGTLSQNRAEKVYSLVFYIYQYYDSISKGEQISFSKVSNTLYYQIERNAQLCHVSFKSQMDQFFQEKRFQFEDLQCEQENEYIRRKTNTTK